jgi:hypothetical protein
MNCWVLVSSCCMTVLSHILLMSAVASRNIHCVALIWHNSPDFTPCNYCISGRLLFKRLSNLMNCKRGCKSDYAWSQMIFSNEGSRQEWCFGRHALNMRHYAENGKAVLKISALNQLAKKMLRFSPTQSTTCRKLQCSYFKWSFQMHSTEPSLFIQRDHESAY